MLKYYLFFKSALLLKIKAGGMCMQNLFLAPSLQNYITAPNTPALFILHASERKTCTEDNRVAFICLQTVR